MSMVESGPLQGKSLRELVENDGDELLGEKFRARSKKFPLLIKLIDAKDRLSVQVHPNERTAPLTGGEPKTEMWYALDGTPDAVVYAGLAPGITKETLYNHLQNQHLRPSDMESMLKRHPLKPGEVIFIPGGLVHTIDRGSFLFEVQQNSDTTYRLWDWGRVDGNGKPRELHLQQAMASMENGVHASVIPLRIAPRGQNPETPWMANELFVAKTLTVTKTLF